MKFTRDGITKNAIEIVDDSWLELQDIYWQKGDIISLDLNTQKFGVYRFENSNWVLVSGTECAMLNSLHYLAPFDNKQEDDGNLSDIFMAVDAFESSDEEAIDAFCDFMKAKGEYK